MREDKDQRILRYRSFLRDVYFFRNLQDDEIGLLAELCFEESFDEGAVIFSEGSAGDRCYIVIVGLVEVWKDYGGAARNLLGVHGSGHLFGEMALIDELPRSATLIARKRTEALAIPRDGFRRLVRQNASIAVSIMTSISLMVRESNETFVLDLRERNERLERALSELEAAQKELLRVERLYTVGKFSSLILHDIRNPLAAVRSLTQLMELRLDDPVSLASDLARMRGEISRMERLASELLDYSRGDIRLVLVPVPPERLLARLADEMKERLGAAGVDLHLDCSDPRPFMLDEERMLRLLINLADNARKAMPGGGNLRLKARREADWLVLLVEDDGEGMDEETLARIFEPFYSRSSGGGTGLGMLIVKNIVEAHGGFIEIHSSPGGGTRIAIRLPERA